MEQDGKFATKRLLIVFVKNIKQGKVKTRLAASIGDNEAIKVYNKLIDVTETATMKFNSERIIYYSEFVEDNRWSDDSKQVQSGRDLGERMKNAFTDGFTEGYKKVVLIGSDLPDISSEVIEEAFAKLEKNEVVFGPADDGGYYLIGLTKIHPYIFDNKPWSKFNLLEFTLDELNNKKVGYALLNSYNDVDTFEDLKASTLYTEYTKTKTHK